MNLTEIVQNVKQALTPRRKQKAAPQKSQRQVPVMLARKVAGKWHRYTKPVYPLGYQDGFWRFPVGHYGATVGFSVSAIECDMRGAPKRGFDSFRIVKG
jgi:hypothetical protein